MVEVGHAARQPDVHELDFDTRFGTIVHAACIEDIDVAPKRELDRTVIDRQLEMCAWDRIARLRDAPDQTIQPPEDVAPLGLGEHDADPSEHDEANLVTMMAGIRNVGYRRADRRDEEVAHRQWHSFVRRKDSRS